LCSITVPCFAQSFDPDAGTGNILPQAANPSGSSAYAMPPDSYRYSRAQASRRIHHPAYRAGRNPKMIDRDYSND
jgi:hypothetical protein